MVGDFFFRKILAPPSIQWSKSEPDKVVDKVPNRFKSLNTKLVVNDEELETSKSLTSICPSSNPLVLVKWTAKPLSKLYKKLNL